MPDPSVPGLSVRQGSGQCGRLLAVRSDLRSRTGYARAARALIGLVPEPYRVLGVDIHPDPHDRDEVLDVPLVDDAALLRLVAGSAEPPVVLHHTAPDNFRFFPGARNVGAFYWETSAVPVARSWGIKLNLMDAIWAPTHFVAEFTRRAGFGGLIDTVTWPYEFAAAVPRGRDAAPSLSTAFIQRVRAEGAPATVPVKLMALRQQADTVFLAVQSLAPRKGTVLLLNEWRAHIRQRPGRHVLLMRLAFRHAADIHREPMAHLGDLLRDAGFKDGDAAQVALLPGPVSETELEALYRLCDAYVTASFGEGFGGPIVEALQQGCPVIAPRHTGIEDLLAPDYPFIIESRSVIVGLKGGIPAYPVSANWHVPVPGSLAGCLARFTDVPPTERRRMAEAARTHVAAVCGRPVVRRQLAAALARLEGPPPEGR